MTSSRLDNIYLRDKVEMYKEIVRAVDIHCKAMELVISTFLINIYYIHIYIYLFIYYLYIIYPKICTFF